MATRRGSDSWSYTGTGPEGELHAHCAEGVPQRKANGLLRIHVGAIVRGFHPVRDFEVQARVA
ncbi:MAG: hypothetical protein HIU89_06355 [Proteobacteria bacterium]|nr:hypothetical protein [Pseudomonadota bacterium]